MLNEVKYYVASAVTIIDITKLGEGDDQERMDFWTLTME